MNQSKVAKWLKFFYHLFWLGVVALLILLSLAICMMFVDDLNLASIIIILLVAILVVILFRKIH